ncbi:hypothetical protein RJ640_003803 [Escallonia rubra]|uniref:Nudix hydrolase domain-containing protein n=1 Tax=Escallonia rubra TaxID=112253 RepID=A0AA88UMD4_9ASTE|nr:hypothetical protein RJ640_003803 [Escallonia rubra]
MELKNMVALVARNGRHLQRYNNKGRRQVVGCIPYRYKVTSQTSPKHEDGLEVLVITSQRKGKGMLFPKGGWEMDEKIEEAALRETVEEAGVMGTVEDMLGKWIFKSKGNDAYHEGYMFPLLVKEQLDLWPEKDIRQRLWMSVEEAREACHHGWMKDALNKLERRFLSEQQQGEEKMDLAL